MTTVSEPTILMPRRSNRFSAITPSFLPASRSALGQTKPRVLVVDDERAICDLLSLYLGHKGLEVATVQTADEARALLEQGQFDLVVLDLKLDGAEGLDLLHLSKAQHPDIPVIIFTGTDLSEGSIKSGLAREADAIVRKMGPLDAVCVEVFRHLNRRQAHALTAA
jgi:DNA-binding response OmpR family regulator